MFGEIHRVLRSGFFFLGPTLRFARTARPSDVVAGMEVLDALTGKIIAGAIEVHSTLGRGLLESAYEVALARELELTTLAVQRQVSLPLQYKGVSVECAYRMDLVVEQRVLIEVKSVETLLSVHSAQTLTYLRLSGLRVALLLNFWGPTLKQGIRRFIRDP